ncbi:MAG: HAD family hydrolase [Bacteroidales bacterium]|nr:HAD family hydrolase [Bacteroidales bacterium]
MALNFSKYKAILFDFDGTLYEPNHFGRRLVFGNLLYAFRDKRERLVRKSMQGCDYGSSEEFYNVFFKKFGEGKREWYFKKYLPLMVEVLGRHFPARPNAQALIDRLQEKGKIVGVLSDYPMIAERSEAIGLRFNNNYFWSTEFFGALKPCKRPFIAIAEQLGIKPKEILVIGDRPDTDAKGAEAAGCDYILVETKKNKDLDGYNIMPWSDITNGLCE